MKQTIQSFETQFMNYMGFTQSKNNNFTLCENKSHPEYGYVMRYTRPGYYTIGIGDYTIPDDFQIAFGHEETILKFGTVYFGETSYKMEGSEVGSFTPASFLTVESHPEGVQTWKRGQHFHGTEITIYPKYLEEVIRPVYGESCLDLNRVPHNITQKYLPADLVRVIHQIENIFMRKTFTEMLLDSKVLECIAIISSEYNQLEAEVFTNRYKREQVRIGKNRVITLSIEDMEIIKKAHEILTEHACRPVTIAQLSQQLHIHEQKLKAGFSHLYHMTIWEYANSVRMSEAASLLATTDKSVGEIAAEVGYSSVGSFSNMFRKNFLKSPNEFRKYHAYSSKVRKT